MQKCFVMFVFVMKELHLFVDQILYIFVAMIDDLYLLKLPITLQHFRAQWLYHNTCSKIK